MWHLSISACLSWMESRYAGRCEKEASGKAGYKSRPGMMNSDLPIRRSKSELMIICLKPFTREELTEAVQKVVQGLEQAEAAGSEKKLENMGEGKTKYRDYVSCD